MFNNWFHSSLLVLLYSDIIIFELLMLIHHLCSWNIFQSDRKRNMWVAAILSSYNVCCSLSKTESYLWVKFLSLGIFHVKTVDIALSPTKVEEKTKVSMVFIPVWTFTSFFCLFVCLEDYGNTCLLFVYNFETCQGIPGLLLPGSWWAYFIPISFPFSHPFSESFL